jgi:hypothetical protein
MRTSNRSRMVRAAEDGPPSSGRRVRFGREVIQVGEEHPFANLLREFSMEGLAILLPGFGFIAASIPAIWLPLFFFAVVLDYQASKWSLLAADGPPLFKYLLRTVRDANGPLFLETFTKALNLLSSFHIESFIAVTGISYMIGHLMFRRDPKLPDFMSFVKITSLPIKGWRRPVRWFLRVCGTDFRFVIKYDDASTSTPSGKWERLRTVVVKKTAHSVFEDMARPERDQQELKPEMVQFPYNHLKDYLHERNFTSLEDFVYWTGESRHRSKYFINALKINLEFLYPKESRRVFINEGHTRLASSVWYACSYIRILGIIGMFVSIAATALLSFRNPSIVLFPLVTVLLAVAIQSSTELTFHYQRCREVFYVLQLALLASRDSDAVLTGVPGVRQRARRSNNPLTETHPDR